MQRLITRQSLAVFVFTLVLASASSVFAAWTNPSQTAPNGNVDGPVNVGTVPQVKNGDLGVNNLLSTGVAQFGNPLNGNTKLGNDGNAYMEMRESDGAGSPYIDFANDASTDFDMRLILTGNDSLDIEGGNVGIGTASPGYKLDVGDVSRLFGQVQISGGTSSAWPLLGFDAVWNGNGAGGWTNTFAGYPSVIEAMQDNGRLAFLTNGSTQAATASFPMSERMSILQNGNVGIGTASPNEPLEVSNTSVGGRFIVSNGNGATRQVLLLQSPTATVNYARLVAHNYGAGVGVNLAINDTGGNVGIGTVTPTQKLDVAGTVQATAFVYSSDAHLKNIIGPIKNALDKVLALSGVDFTWKSGSQEGKKDIGVIAQDVQKVAPEAVHEGENGMLSVDYPRLVPILINAIKEQQGEIESLKARVDALEKN